MKPILTALLTVAILIAPATAVAETPQKADPATLFYLKVEPLQNLAILTINKPSEPPKPKHTVYTVVRGDNLTKIGTRHKVEWQRLWAKNKQLKNPDLIHVGDKITIPFPNEKLKRSIPSNVKLPDRTPGVVPTRMSASYNGGNTYDYGYCTWYVKNKRGNSIPNGLGNANTWYSIAKSMGLSVGSVPKAGAVGTSTAGTEGHVVYVESVNKNGTVNISEMNYKAWGVASTRTVSASVFLYIY